MLEAEVLFLAGHRLRIPIAKFLSWFGFALALREISRQFFGESTVIGGLRVANATPPLAVMAVLFYLNRYLSKTEPYWSYFASALVTVVALRETRSTDWLGIVPLAWAALLFEFGFRRKLREFRVQSYAASALSIFIILAAGMLSEAFAWPAAIAASVFYAQTLRCAFWLRDTSPHEQRFVSIGGSLATMLLAALTIHRTVPAQWEAAALMATCVVFFELGIRGLPTDLIWITRAFSVLLALTALLDAPGMPTSAAIAALQFLLHFRARHLRLFEAHGTAGALILTAILFREVSGGMLTLSLSLEAIGLLAVGFAARDRWLRLSGLVLLLLCIGKVFFYDLRSLETVYRIFSFIGLGMILLTVSWIYTRFREQMRKLL